MSDEEVIKNPARTLSQDRVPYEPEYKRLGKEPKNLYTKTNIEYATFDSTIVDEHGKETAIDFVIDNNDDINIQNGFSIKPVNEPIAVPEIGEYILMIDGQIIMSGVFDKVQDRVKAIIYGEDKTVSELAPSIEDVVVLKRIGIKVGVFLND